MTLKKPIAEEVRGPASGKGNWLWWIAAGIGFVCFQQTGFSLSRLVQGFPQMAGFAMKAMPPDFTHFHDLMLSMILTVEIAVVGTIIAFILSLFLCLGAASNFAPNPVVYYLCRTILNLFRSISEMIIALLFVTAVGLGAFSGVLALSVHSAGMMGKFFAESIENIDEGQVEAIRAVGGSKWQIFRYAVVPQVLPEFITTTLFRWETNIRSATVLGMVGAGGIGFDLITSVRLFQYQETSAIILMTLVTVIMIDQVNHYLRAKII